MGTSIFYSSLNDEAPLGLAWANNFCINKCIAQFKVLDIFRTVTHVSYIHMGSATGGGPGGHGPLRKYWGPIMHLVPPPKKIFFFGKILLCRQLMYSVCL